MIKLISILVVVIILALVVLYFYVYLPRRGKGHFDDKVNIDDQPAIMQNINQNVDERQKKKPLPTISYRVGERVEMSNDETDQKNWYSGIVTSVVPLKVKFEYSYGSTNDTSGYPWKYIKKKETPSTTYNQSAPSSIPTVAPKVTYYQPSNPIPQYQPQFFDYNNDNWNSVQYQHNWNPVNDHYQYYQTTLPSIYYHKAPYPNNYPLSVSRQSNTIVYKWYIYHIALNVKANILMKTEAY
jgi:hypothetical protein